MRTGGDHRYLRGVTELAVNAQDLVKSFKRQRAVDRITLTVAAGERVGLLGPNGAGKTTTLLMLLGAVTPDSGTVEISGLRLPRHRSKAMLRVGFVAGYLPLPENLTVRESLELFAGFAGLRRRQANVDAAAGAFGLTELMAKRNQELSSGQRTLVSIVKAVLHRPALLILDEPTASLDPDIAARVREAMLEAHRRDGTALLVTSHNMREVETLCERVVLLSQGRVVANGSPYDIASQFDVEDLESAFLAIAQAQRGPR
ncbi:ABC transporter [Rhizocola hellebori]|uniref:ABC transporter n=1 Tax=Rhizocola hellebori TaxID=1392758 RepID=A0A8J3QFE0_9ACTN|nr:ABC transporter [Rhizocola hellebori]